MDDKEVPEEKIDQGDNMEELDYEASDNVEEEGLTEQSSMDEVFNSEDQTSKNNDEMDIATNNGDETKVEAPSEPSVEDKMESDVIKDKEVKKEKSVELKDRPGEKKAEPRRSKDRQQQQQTVCKPCNLVFENQRWLDTHTKSGDHSHVVKGFKPSSGRYYCYLCWLGFQHSEMLLHHVKRSDHQTRARRKGVSGMVTRPGEDRGRRSNSSHRRSTSSHRRSGGDRSRSPVRVRLGDYYELSSVGECETRGARLRRIDTDTGRETSQSKGDSKAESVLVKVSNGKEETAEDGLEEKSQISNDLKEDNNEMCNEISNDVCNDVAEMNGESEKIQQETKNKDVVPLVAEEFVKEDIVKEDSEVKDSPENNSTCDVEASES